MPLFCLFKNTCLAWFAVTLFFYFFFQKVIFPPAQPHDFKHHAQFVGDGYHLSRVPWCIHSHVEQMIVQQYALPLSVAALFLH